MRMREKNVLIMDDSSTIRQGILLVLQQAQLFNHYFEASTAHDGLEALKRNDVELVICDIVMPGMDGYEFLQEMKSHMEWRDIPVIMLTGQVSVDKKIKGLDLGASDYLTKPFDPGELIARVRVQLKVKHLQDELRIAKQRYKELSITDYLTEIYNRRHFMEIFDMEFSRATRYNHNLAVIIFDIDNFKHTNDQYGHLVGDKVLKKTADLVKSEIRSHDVFARYGGEEFVLMLPSTPPQGALLVAEKIREQVMKQKIREMDNKAITISIGVAVYPHSKAQDGAELINAADSALYRAKANGKNRVELSE